MERPWSSGQFSGPPGFTLPKTLCRSDGREGDISAAAAAGIRVKPCPAAHATTDTPAGVTAGSNTPSSASRKTARR
ncbi:hypothetical protein, partial [uncultured Desulfovibrio sp.]|uniref:hypothetical protein n=1 Tax=uncultured Desulfovibrio sp. TaxID=167968 RepID=UPI0026182813